MTVEKAKDCMTNHVPVLVSPEYLEAHFSEYPELKEHPCFIIAVRSNEVDLSTFDNESLEAVALCMIDLYTGTTDDRIKVETMTHGVVYAKNVMIDTDGINLEEGVNISDENGHTICEVVGYSVDEDDDEIGGVVEYLIDTYKD